MGSPGFDCPGWGSALRLGGRGSTEFAWFLASIRRLGGRVGGEQRVPARPPGGSIFLASEIAKGGPDWVTKAS
jgi:hypothetical protein